MSEQAKWPVVEHIDYTVEARANGRTHRPSPWRNDLSEVREELAAFANMNRSAEWLIIRRVRTSTETPLPVAAVSGSREAGGQE